MDMLRHLQFFVTVAETRHFGDAARALGMTQPPLSQGVQRLERHLGVRLFDRDARGVRITAEGSALLGRAVELLDQASRLREEADALVIPDQLRLGLVADLEGRAPALVAGLAERGSAVLPSVGGSVELVDRLVEGDLDVAVVRHPTIVDGTVAGEVITFDLRLVSPGTARAETVALRDLALPVAVSPRHHHPSAHDQLVDTLRRAGHSGDTVEEPDPLAREALVASGRAVRLTADPDRGTTISGTAPALRVRVLRAGREPDSLSAHAARACEELLRSGS